MRVLGVAGGGNLFAKRKKALPNHWTLPTRRERRGGRMLRVLGNASNGIWGVDVIIN